MKKMKERKSWFTLQQGRFFSYLGDPWSRGLSMAMEFSPNMGAGSKQFECNLCTFSGHFDARNGFWCKLNLLENMLNARFLCTIVLVCEN